MNNFLFLNKINNTIIAVLLSFCRHIYIPEPRPYHIHIHIFIYLFFFFFFLLLIRIHPKYRWIYCKLLFIATEFPSATQSNFYRNQWSPLGVRNCDYGSVSIPIVVVLICFVVFAFCNIFLLLIFFCHIDENVKSVQNGLGYSEAVATRALSAFTGRATFSAANQNAAPVWRQTNQNGIRILKNHKIAKVQL